MGKFELLLLLALSCFYLVTSVSSAVPEKYLKTREEGDGRVYKKPLTKFTERPIIGILTLPVTVGSQKKFGNSSFATSYARWVESGGARVVPIFYDASAEQLDFLLNRLSGVFWTGGLVDFNPSVTDPEGAKYLKTTEHIWRHVVDQNRAGNYYPMWATCLGFERMSQLFANDTNAEILEEVDAENFDINLELTSDGWLSRIFGGMSYQLFKAVASPLGHLAFNNHGLGIHPDAFRTSPANLFLKVLSVDQDRNGKLFVSTVEGRDFPFYGVQWHPEKAPFEWTPKYTMAHSSEAIEFSNYLGRYFVDECKYNRNSFESDTVEGKFLINNWRSFPTGRAHGIISAYSEIYFFNNKYPFSLSSSVPKAQWIVY